MCLIVCKQLRPKTVTLKGLITQTIYRRIPDIESTPAYTGQLVARYYQSTLADRSQMCPRSYIGN